MHNISLNASPNAPLRDFVLIALAAIKCVEVEYCPAVGLW